MASYDRVAKVVAPKRIALAEAEEAYAVVEADLKAKQVSMGLLNCNIHIRQMCAQNIWKWVFSTYRSFAQKCMRNRTGIGQMLRQAEVTHA